jgi:lysophospholipase L1-like esterase
MFKGWPARASFVLIGVVIALAVAEVSLRLLPLREHKAHFVTDPVLHHRLRADWQGTVQGLPYHTNALGLRDRDVVPKAPGAIRVLMLGDSFTEGGGLAEADTVPRRVETTLRPTCPGLEVINAGVASYSPILEYLMLQKIGAALGPDLVVLNLDMTDVHDDLIRTALAQLDSDGLPIRVTTDRRREAASLLPPVLSPSLRTVDDAMSRLLLWQSLRRSPAGRRVFGELNLDEGTLVARGLIGDLHYDRLAITRDSAAAGEATAWATTERYLVGVHRAATSLGARFVVIAYPYPHQVAPFESPGGRARFGIGSGLYASDRPFRAADAIGRRRGFAVISLLDAFRRHTDPARPLFREDDVHHTAAGARVMADGIAEGLLEAGLIPRCAR